ncbi:MAG: TraR/DksA C4-type zinc finger protein [Chitinophagaceae bacterium]|jgi:RNA polymerase-binding transcription factor DksA|nr:TraR/DksA C4-type zinc finger protein [Chitinophagaceae bacterium]
MPTSKKEPAAAKKAAPKNIAEANAAEFNDHPQETAAAEKKAAAKKAAKATGLSELDKVEGTAIKKSTEKKESVKQVKLPKITAEGKVPYEPDFTHSVLDSPKENAPVTTPTQRYSDSDLAEFRELIMRKLETAKKELAYLQGLITRKDDTGGDNEDGRYMTMEDGTLSMEREQLSQMASRQITFIDHLEKALIRIENKTYGICRETGKLIDKARLRAVPHATLSVEAKMKKSR